MTNILINFIIIFVKHKKFDKQTWALQYIILFN